MPSDARWSKGWEDSVDHSQDKGGRRDFGQVSQLRSGRWQARWKINGRWYTARRTDKDNHDLGPLTFSTPKQASDHLAWVKKETDSGRWSAPVKESNTHDDNAPATLREVADDWLARRELKPTTRAKYRAILDRAILPKLGDLPLTDVDQDVMDRWYAGLDPAKRTWRAHSYALLRSILREAHKRKKIGEVPSIDGAGRVKRAREIRVLEPAELAALTAAMPERFRPMVLLSAWCGLRYGEVTALLAADVDLRKAVLHVRRGVTRTRGEWHVSTPKGGVGRTVRIPASILPMVKAHMRGLGPDALLFPAARGGYMIAPTFGKAFRAAAKAIGRPDVRVHDLRHFGLVRYAMAGASLSELIARGGHRTVSAATVYFNVAKDRDAELTERMDQMANGGTVTPISSAKSKLGGTAAAK
jgi:integrase